MNETTTPTTTTPVEETPAITPETPVVPEPVHTPEAEVPTEAPLHVVDTPAVETN